jgi:PadR family transcriptional regulator PadR
MARRSAELLYGTLEVLTLKALSQNPLHGYAVARWIEDRTSDVIQVEEGSLYPALYRLEKRGWIEAEWGVSDLGRKAKLYSLTRRGRQELARETERWSVFASAISRVLLPVQG